MTQVETRTIGYGLAASVAVHILVFASLGFWMSSEAFSRRLAPPPPPPAEESNVTLVFADAIETEPEPLPEPEPEQAPAPPATPPKQPDRYIRTTQNQDAANAPEKADFISDRNTVATAKLAPSATGDPSMPTTDGVGFITNELANRDFKDGDIKQDSAPSPPPTPPTPPPSPATTPPDQLAMRQPDPPPQAQPKTPPPSNMAKKTDSPMEDMMQDLDQKLADQAATENPAIEIRRAAPVTAQDMPPAEPTPPAQQTPPSPPPLPVPRAIPMPDPIANTRNPQEDSFQPHTRIATNKGTISNRGDLDAVNAAATPTGRYMRQVTSTIERKWHVLRKANQDFVSPGKLRIRFYVNKDGATEDITILENQANAVLTDFSLTAILKADLPPIPKDLLPILEKGRVEIEYDIVIY